MITFPKICMSNSFKFHFLAGIILLLVLTGAPVQAQQPLPLITYRLSTSRPVSHLFEVSIEVELPKDAAAQSIEFQMAKWSPGRYAVFDFAKNVQQFRAVAGVCPVGAKCKTTPLDVTRVDNQTWSVTPLENKSLTVSYKVFGNDLSGTFSELDSRHANFNGGSIFMYLVGHKPDPVRLVIDPPAGWRIVNGRMDHAGQREWEFANWDLMIDTPTEIAPDWTQDDFAVGGKKYHVVVHSFGDEGGKRAALVRDIEKIVRAETAMWGPPEFDSYTFLLHFAGDDHSGDGMEHLTSTQIIEPGVLAEPETYQDALGTVAHEFFHVWNVKRLRPIELGPWDFSRPANTRGLWVAEGFTNYYGHVMMRRAKLWNETQFLRRESQTIGGIEEAPGSRLMSAEESSLSASFLDDAPHAQQTDLANTSVSYYPKGELMALVLDLLIRGKTAGKASLDDVMRRMYEEFYLKSSNNSYYLRGRGYTTQDLERVASEVADTDLSDFFRRYTNGVETLPYDEVLSYVGLRLVREQMREPFNAGLSLNWEDPEAVVVGSVRHESPAEDAGLEAGDELVSIGGKKISRDNWLKTLARFKEGDRVPLVVKRDRKTNQVTLTLGPPDRFEYRIEEKKDATAAEKALRAQWLN